MHNGVTRRQLLTAIGGTLMGSNLACRRSGSASEVRIGALCELSGPSSTIGTEQAHGIQFAVDEINASGIPGHQPGINGRPIRLYLEDSESKVSTGLGKAKKLIERDRVHAAFFGAGAYASAIVIVHGGVTSIPAILTVALTSTALLGGIVGFLSSRVGRVAVFLVTFACAEVIYLVVHADPRGLTNGDNGVPGIVARPLLGLDLTGRLSFYYTALAVIVLSYIVLGRITRSQFGEVLLAIRDNETRVRFSGYRVEQYKTAAFVVSALFAGLAGSLTAFHVPRDTVRARAAPACARTSVSSARAPGDR